MSAGRLDAIVIVFVPEFTEAHVYAGLRVYVIVPHPVATGVNGGKT
jgi:hypothetical protein